MKKKKSKFPDFNKMSYEEEANWWDTHDIGNFWDEIENVGMVIQLQKPKDETVVVRLQKSLKDKLEKVAKARGLTVSTLTRIWLAEKLQSRTP